MGNIYRTANGKRIDIDSVRTLNENAIAIGNMKVNARGDQLGPGGKVVKTRDQVMKEYYALNTPVAVDLPVQADAPALTPAQARQARRDPAPAPVVAAPAPVIVPPAASGLDEFDDGPEAPFDPKAATPELPPEAPVADVEFKAALDRVVERSGLTPPPTPVVAAPVVPVATPKPAKARATQTKVEVQQQPAPVVAEQTMAPPPPVNAQAVTPPPMRGSMASAVREATTVTQTPRLPAKKANGIQRF